ncbi:AprI/Inh family metalloprotease inhibitor [Beijerinckia sp. L45]|uniref:AprI/Inh family metalloprotease inhibitor n=1 Tax=Beijerinckia sp. L45 TaxID=1641855 RepID=UPI00131C3C4F|nr:AprI/Inh family metalloprotease inhibitor [Beijerinckia sp. L45]
MTSILSLPAAAKSADDIVGQWDVMREQGSRPCRITLNGERSDKGDFFVGVPVACRRVVPILAKVGRWTLGDATHLTLMDPGGRALLALAADGDAFSGQGSDGATYRLVYVPAMGRSATSGDASDLLQGKPPVGQALPPAVISLATGVAAASDAPVKPSRVATERMGDLAGRYAVLRDKTHDTGCMLTLDDKTRVKGGARAALAPACRDQGIVVFDPTAWQIVNGRLVLTAKAGHMTHLDKQADGSWLKDPAEGKSLSLKKL